MCGYQAFYKGKKIEVYAESSFQALMKAAKLFKVKPGNTHQITVVLCEKDGEPVIHKGHEITD